MPLPQVHPNPENCSRAELETAAACTPTKKNYIRLNAIRLLFNGFPREQVAFLSFVSLRTLGRWVKAFNERGIDGLLEKPRSGRPRKITPAKTTKYRRLLEHPEQAGQEHWTAKKFFGYLRDELNEEVGYRTVVRWLHDNNYRLKVPRPWPDRRDEQLRAAFVDKLKEWLADEQVDLWFCDEMGVEGDPRPRRRWVQKGSKPTITKNGDHLRMNVTGLVCPRSGYFYALEFSHSDTECFQTFLHHANADISFERPRNLLICDNASWHKATRLDWGAFEPIYLPPYSPDLNPIERLWLLIKAEWFADFVAKDREALMERLDKALRTLTLT